MAMNITPTVEYEREHRRALAEVATIVVLVGAMLGTATLSVGPNVQALFTQLLPALHP